MALPWKRQQPDTAVPAELAEYYQGERRARRGVAWLLALATLVVTLVLATALFFGGRWVWRTIADRNDKKPLTTTQQQSGSGQPSEQQTQGGTPSADSNTSNTANTDTSTNAGPPNAGTGASTTTSPQGSSSSSTNTPAAVPNTGPDDTPASLVNTGPGDE